MELNSWGLALTLSLLAGLSTGLGGLFVLFLKNVNTKLLSISLGFSAGIMIYISFMEILPEAKLQLVSELSESAGGWITLASFLAGILLIAVIDKLIPSHENPHEIRQIHEVCQYSDSTTKPHLMRTGLLTAVAITIHNFPEGMATFISGISHYKLGIAVAIAVAIHNIPEGISVAIPIYCATGNRRKAFFFSLLSGITEPLGAVIAFLFLAPFLSELLLGILFAAVAGIMVYISFDELLPTAQQCGEHHLVIYGLFAGMLVMGVSMQLLL